MPPEYSCVSIDLNGVALSFNLRPTEDAFYGFFSKASQNLQLAADLLSKLILPAADVQSICQGLVEAEHTNDALTHALYKKINSTFVTPFDRGDIYRLGSQLDDVMDHLEAIGGLLGLYGLADSQACPREVCEMVEVLVQQAEVTAAVMPRLKAMKGIEEYWIECKRLENEGDRIYRMLLVRLFSGEYDALTVLKLKEVADELEAACDAFEYVARTVETIAIKES